MATLKKLAGLPRSFALFWWDFVVGDDVTLAIGVVAGLAAVALLHHAGQSAWWGLPVLWVIALGASLARAVRRGS